MPNYVRVAGLIGEVVTTADVDRARVAGLLAEVVTTADVDRVRVAGLIVEIVTTEATSGSPQSIDVGQSTETDSAGLAAVVLIVPIGQTTETDTTSAVRRWIPSVPWTCTVPVERRSIVLDSEERIVLVRRSG